MILPILLSFASAAAAQPAAVPATTATPRRAGRAFMSPMGEPFFGRTPGEDGLVVWFAQADANHDGVLTVDEMKADAQRFFESLDVNHDGEIDPDEITRYETVVAPQLRVRPIVTSEDLPGGERDVQYDDESSAGRFGLLKIPEPVASADSNWNRGVSADEFRKAASDRFQLLDVAHSGRLTLAGLETIRQAAASAADRSRAKPVDPGADPHSAEHGRSSY